jgi:hypothetical protein
MLNKRLINTGEAAPAPFDPLQNFEAVTYTGNGGTQKITGYIRKGAAFNGSSSKILVPASSFPIGTSPRSFSCWVKSTNTTSNQALVQYGTSSPNLFWVWRLNGANTSSMEFSDFNITHSVNASSTNLFDGNFHHVAITWNGSSIQFYVDGNTLGGAYSYTSQNTSNTIVGIGAYASGDVPLYGSIDQVRIFNTALNSTQVGQLALEDYTDPKKSTTDYFGNGSGVALYELDEDANSSNFEQAAVFNGSSRITSDDPVKNDTTFSISAWINVDNINTFNPIISVYGSSAGTRKYLFRVSDSNSLDFFTYDESGVITGIVQESSALTVGTWHHVAATVESGGDLELYLDGVSVATDTGNSNVNTDATADLIIGSRDDYAAGSSVNNFNGKIDQVRIYSSALDSTDVEKLYKESADVPTSNLVAHYKLDGNATDETETYDGTASNVTYSAGVYGGTPTNINFLGMAFQPDLVWVKNRSVAVNHYLYDSIRGTGAAKALHSNTTDSEASASVYSVNGGVQSIDSNGFTAFEGTDGTYQGTNKSGNNYVAWCWKAGGTAVSNTNGTITSTVSANQDAGFSIVKYTTPSGGAGTVGHGLSTTPEIYITKRTDSTSNWYFNTTAIDGSLDYLLLNTTSAKTDSSGITAPTSTVFSASNFGTQGEEWITYCFHSVDGYQKVGSYSGGTANQTITTGFKPRWIMIKCTSGYVENWVIYDSVRSPSDPRNDLLLANVPNSEYANYSTHHINFNSDGFTLIQASSAANGSGGTYIYLAIA